MEKPVYSRSVMDILYSDTISMPIISENGILKFFNLERNDIQCFNITHKANGIYVNITLNQKYHQCPVCGQMTKKSKIILKRPLFILF